MPKISGINHITLATKNLTIALDFYKGILGCELVAEWDAGAYLLAGNSWKFTRLI